MTGIADAHMDSIPIIASPGRWRPPSSERTHSRKVTSSACWSRVKQSYILDDPHEIPRVVKEAFYLANTGERTGQHRFPKDIANGHSRRRVRHAIRYPVPPSGILKDQLADRLMASAERPVVFVGHGVIQAGRRGGPALPRAVEHAIFLHLHGISALPADIRSISG